MPTQKFKICVGDHPDDIKKWIEERKKRFPRRNATANAVDQGEVTNGNCSTECSKKREREEYGTEGATDGTKRVSTEGAKQESKPGSGALSSLLAGYDSSSSVETPSNNTPAKEQPKEGAEMEKGTTQNSQSTGIHTNTATTTTTQQRVCRFHQRGKCRHGSSCKFLHSDKVEVSTEQQQAKRKAQSEHDKARIHRAHELQILGLATPSHATRNSKGDGKVINNTSLLHKLLQRDKERERRLTLQLLRFVVDSNYLGAGQVEQDGSEGEERNEEKKQSPVETNVDEA